VVGVKKVVNLLRPYPAVSVNPAIGTIRLNGGVGVRIDDEVGGTTIVSLVVEEGRITRIFAMRNPHKLTRLDEESDLTVEVRPNPAFGARRIASVRSGSNARTHSLGTVGT